MMTDAAPKEGLRSRVLRGSSWIFSGDVAKHAISLGTNLVMTRLLVPEMFGVMALASTFIVGAALFSDLGLTQNIIQSKRGDSPKFLNTAWIVQICRSGIIALFILIMAMMLKFFRPDSLMAGDSALSDPILVPVLVVLALNAFLEGFESTKLATAARELNLKPVVRLELTSQIAAIPVMVIWAMIDRSIWALVVGALIGTIVKCVLSHMTLPGSPNRFQWDKSAFSEIFHFGKWLFLSSILGFLYMDGDVLVLGYLIDASSLGAYSIAGRFADAAVLITLGFIFNVGLSALSEVSRERPEDIRDVYYKLRLPIDLLYLFTSGFLFIFGSTLIEILYDSRYFGAGYMLEVLAISLISERYMLTNQYFMAIGKPQFLSYVFALRVIAMFVATPIAFKMFGEEGAIWAIACNGYVCLPLVFYLKYRYDILSIAKEVYVFIALPIGVFSAIFANYLVSIWF